MAWYTLYKWFISWRKTPYINWIKWYKRYLYDEWFCSLSEENQKAELKRQQRVKEKRKHDGEMALARLGMMFNMINEVTGRSMYDYIEAAKFVNKIGIHPSKY